MHTKSNEKKMIYKSNDLKRYNILINYIWNIEFC
jgi:hypothetical protein